MISLSNRYRRSSLESWLCLIIEYKESHTYKRELFNWMVVFYIVYGPGPPLLGSLFLCCFLCCLF
uniref:Uncharacterized protein n=1 Tax=Cannabis sativa TaxID=3483 RepID=A0A803RBI3_CANSA